MNSARMLLKNLYQNNGFLWNGGASNVRLLQSYEALWIHVIDAICKFTQVKLLIRDFFSLAIASRNYFSAIFS